MKVKPYRQGNTLFVQIETDTNEMRIKVDNTKPLGAAMRESAADIRERAQQLIRQAELIEAASLII